MSGTAASPDFKHEAENAIKAKTGYTVELVLKEPQLLLENIKAHAESTGTIALDEAFLRPRRLSDASLYLPNVFVTVGSSSS